MYDFSRPLNLVPIEYYVPPAWIAGGRRRCREDPLPETFAVLERCQLHSPYLRALSIAGGEWFPDATQSGAVAGATTIDWMFLYDDFFDPEYDSTHLHTHKPDTTHEETAASVERRLIETLRTEKLVESAAPVDKLAFWAMRYARQQQAESGASDGVFERLRHGLIDFCLTPKLSNGRWQRGMTWDDYLQVRLVNIGTEPLIWLGLLTQGYQEDPGDAFLSSRPARECVALHSTTIILQNDMFSYAKEFNAIPNPFNSMHLKRLERADEDLLSLYQAQLQHLHEVVTELDATMEALKGASVDPADYKRRQQFCQAMIDIVVGNHAFSEGCTRYWMPYTRELRPPALSRGAALGTGESSPPGRLPLTEEIVRDYKDARAKPLGDCFRAPAWRQTSQ